MDFSERNAKLLKFRLGLLEPSPRGTYKKEKKEKEPDAARR